jgi:hypothetical protein
MALHHSKPSRVSSPRLSRSGLEADSGRFPPDSLADSMRITRMKTRVAVRDKTPHRFQVVPLRDVSKHGGTQPVTSQWSAPSQSKNNAQRNPSGKLGPYSQSRVFSSSSSIQSILSVPSATDPHELDGASWELTINNTLAATSDNKTLATFHAVVPSIPLRHQDLNPVLAEWDMNREGPVPRMTRNVSPTEPKAQQYGCQKSSTYQGSRDASIRTELIPTHTTSLSLHNASRQKRNYPKFASLSQSTQNSPPISFSGLQISSFDAQAKCRHFADAVTSIGEEFNLGGDKNFLRSFDNQQPLNPKSSRRHAIYTESLYVPYLDEGCEPHSRESTPKGPKFRSDSYPNLDHVIRNENPEFTNSFRLKPPPVELRLEDNLAHQAPFTSVPVSTNSWPSNGLSLPPTARLATSVKLCGLNYPTDKTSRVRLLSGKDSSHSEIIHSRIILDLVAEIDLAIEQWKPVL